MAELLMLKVVLTLTVPRPQFADLNVDGHVHRR